MVLKVQRLIAYHQNGDEANTSAPHLAKDGDIVPASSDRKVGVTG
jgi:hypothetical protein